MQESLSIPNQQVAGAVDTPSPLPILHLRLRFHAADENSRGSIGGDVWRSAFGLHLRRRSCLTGAANCEGCALRPVCVYPQIMETRAGDDAALLREDSEAPNPYVLSPHAAAPGSAQAHLDLTLFGRAIVHAPIAVPTLEAAAAAGLGPRRMRWKLETVERVDARGRVVPWKPGAEVDAVDDALPLAPHAIVVHLESPLRLRVKHRELRPQDFSFPVFFAALLRRASLLTHGFGDATQAPDAACARMLIGCAQGLQLETADLRWQAQRRWSSRQQRSMPMGGIVGRFTLRGDLAPIWPWLWRGQWLHAGKGTVMGLGRYRLEVLREPLTWLVSRHPGAVDFLGGAGQHFDRHVAHLDPEAVRAGDTVIGTLPVNLAARVCERGARYLHLTLDLPEQLRGQELDADQLAALDARLEEYRVERPSPATDPALAAAHADGKSGPRRR